MNWENYQIWGTMSNIKQLGSVDEDWCDSESDDNDSSCSEDEEDPEDKFHYIITENDELGPEIPRIIKLKDPLPKEKIKTSGSETLQAKKRH